VFSQTTADVSKLLDDHHNGFHSSLTASNELRVTLIRLKKASLSPSASCSRSLHQDPTAVTLSEVKSLLTLLAGNHAQFFRDLFRVMTGLETKVGATEECDVLWSFRSLS
jgi:hypothetical protein